MEPLLGQRSVWVHVLWLMPCIVTATPRVLYNNDVHMITGSLTDCGITFKKEKNIIG